MSDHAIVNAKGWLQNIREMVAALNAAESDDEEPHTTIEQSVLSVQVKGGWYTPGEPIEASPEEYEVLLSTGGPALRIYGDIGLNGEPDEWPQIQWQNWGTPWTTYPLEEGDRDVLRAPPRLFLVRSLGHA